jgi:hypothetical protein
MDQPPRDPASAIPWAIPEQAAGADGSPKFGRLLAVLICAVLMIVVITFASEAYFSSFWPDIEILRYGSRKLSGFPRLCVDRAIFFVLIVKCCLRALV